MFWVNHKYLFINYDHRRYSYELMRKYQCFLFINILRMARKRVNTKTIKKKVMGKIGCRRK